MFNKYCTSSTITTLILLGTFISLTLSILYSRQKYILDKVESETSLLVVTTENILTVFEEDDDNDCGSRNNGHEYDDLDANQRIVEIGQCIADYVRLLVMESRGTELMTIIYSDPLVRLLNALAKEKKRQIKATGIYDVSNFHACFQTICRSIMVWVSKVQFYIHFVLFRIVCY